MCKLCTFGNECDVNDPTYNYCKIIYRRFNNLETNLSNSIALKSLFTSNKLVRFRQFALIFSVSIKDNLNYKNIKMRIESKYKNGILIKLEIIIVIFNDDKSCFFVQSRTLRRWVTVVENNSSIVTFISNLYLFYSVSL